MPKIVLDPTESGIEAMAKLFFSATRNMGLSDKEACEVPGVGTIGFSCKGAWTKTAEEQTEHKRKIGVAFYPSKDVLAAVAQAKTMWEGEELHVNETAKS